MAITTLDGPALVSNNSAADVVRLDDVHVLAVFGQDATVIEIVSDALSVGTAQAYDTGASSPVAMLVDQNDFKVASVYGQPSRYLRAANMICDLGTDTFTYSSALLRDSFTANPSFPVMGFQSCACVLGDQVQVFWTEDDSSPGPMTKIEFYMMTVDCSGATPSAGSPVKWFEQTAGSWVEGSPRRAVIVNASSGVLITDQGYFSTFAFGSSPTTPAAITGAGIMSSNNNDAIALTGGVGFATDPNGKGMWLTTSTVTWLSSPAILSHARAARLQTRTVLSANGQDVERIVINGTTIDSVDNNYEYCAACAVSTRTAVVAMQSDNSQAIVLQGTNAYLLGGVPTDDPFPADEGANRIWIYKTTDNGNSWSSRGVKT